MSYWQENLLDASFRGAKFHMQSVSDSVQKALAIYEYPYRDGAEVEDMGRSARRIPVQALFFGDTYFEDMQKLIEAFEQKGKGELIHPVFGSVQVTVQNYSIEHTAERPDYAAIRFECIESNLDTSFFSASSSKGMGQKAAQSAKSAAKSAEDMSIAALVEAFKEVAKLPGIAQAQVLEYLGTVLDVFDTAQSVVRSVLNYIENPLAFVADLAAVLDVPLLDTAARTIDTTQDVFATFTRISSLYPRLPALAGDALYSYATGLAGYSVSYITGVKATEQARAEPILVLAVPKKDAQGLDMAVGIAQTLQGVVATHVQIATAARIVDVAQDMLYTQIASAPTLTPQQMETLAGNGRARLQDAIDYTRAALDVRYIYSTTEGLRTAADALQELAAYALSARPPLTRYTTSFECNFYYLAHYLYKDYTRAAELRFLNSFIRNPNFIAKGQDLVIYAK